MAEDEFRFIPVDQVMERLHTSPHGLSSEEVESRRALYGPNEVVREKKLAAFRQFIGQFKNPLIIILLLAAVLSVFLENLSMR